MRNILSPDVHADTVRIQGRSDTPFGGDLNEVLLLELRHRVNNDLQAILGSVELEQQRAATEQSRDLLDRIVGRIACIAAVYQQLHMSSPAPVDLAEYLQLLCSRVGAARGGDGRCMRLIGSLVSVEVTMDQAVLLGMIVTELTTNTVKHAFRNGEPGCICVQLRRTDDVVELIVRDNGRGESEYVRRGTGLNLVHRLARQVGGTLTCEHGDGRVWRMTFSPVRPVYFDAPRPGY